jgi:hypothetical protein
MRFNYRKDAPFCHDGHVANADARVNKETEFKLAPAILFTPHTKSLTVPSGSARTLPIPEYAAWPRDTRKAEVVSKNKKDST